MFNSKTKYLIERYKPNQNHLSLDYRTKNQIKNIFNLAFENCVFPVINRPTRITKASATAIDHILRNTILDFEVQSGIIRNYKGDHFGTFCVLKTTLGRKNINELII